MTWFKRISQSEIRNILACIIVLGCFILLYLMIVKAIPEGNKDTVNIAVGFVFGGAMAGVIGYYYGAAKSSSQVKDEKKEENGN